MKKYTNKILAYGFLILVIIYSGYFYAIFREVKNEKTDDTSISDPAKSMTITSSIDEDGKTTQITTDPNTGHIEEVTTKTTTTSADMAE